MPDDPVKGVEMQLHLTMAQLYLAEFAKHLQNGNEPYDALLATARGELELTQKQKNVFRALIAPYAANCVMHGCATLDRLHCKHTQLQHPFGRIGGPWLRSWREHSSVSGETRRNGGSRPLPTWTGRQPGKRATV